MWKWLSRLFGSDEQTASAGRDGDLFDGLIKSPPPNKASDSTIGTSGGAISEFGKEPEVPKDFNGSTLDRNEESAQPGLREARRDLCMVLTQRRVQLQGMGAVRDDDRARETMARYEQIAREAEERARQQIRRHREQQESEYQRNIEQLRRQVAEVERGKAEALDELAKQQEQLDDYLRSLPPAERKAKEEAIEKIERQVRDMERQLRAEREGRK